MLKSCKTKPQRGLIGVASQFIGWYQMAMNMRAFRYATSNPYRVPTARIHLTTTLPAIENGWLPLSDAYGIGLTELAKLELYESFVSNS